MLKQKKLLSIAGSILKDDSVKTMKTKLKPVIIDTKKEIKSGSIENVKKCFKFITHVNDINMNCGIVIEDIINSTPAKDVKAPDKNKKYKYLSYEEVCGLLMQRMAAVRTGLMSNDEKLMSAICKNWVVQNGKPFRVSNTMINILKNANKTGAVNAGITLIEYLKHNFSALVDNALNNLAKNLNNSATNMIQVKDQLLRLPRILQDKGSVQPVISIVDKFVNKNIDNYKFVYTVQSVFGGLVQASWMIKTSMKNRKLLTEANVRCVLDMMYCTYHNNDKENGMNLFHDLNRGVLSVPFEVSSKDKSDWSEVKKAYQAEYHHYAQNKKGFMKKVGDTIQNTSQK